MLLYLLGEGVKIYYRFCCLNLGFQIGLQRMDGDLFSLE